MSKKREGESIQSVVEQIDEKGEVISTHINIWYGFDNKMANLFTIGMTRVLCDLMEKFSKAKNAE